MAKRNGVTLRGSSNKNVSGSAEGRRRRKTWLIETYRADVDVFQIYWSSTTEWIEAAWSEGVERLADRSRWVPACRCYRCGKLLTALTVTVDRIVPGCVKTKRYPNGGTYIRENIRPSCSECASWTGGKLRAAAAQAAAKKLALRASRA